MPILQNIYDRSPRCVQTLMLSVRGWQYRRQRTGGEYRRLLEMLMAMQWASADYYADWQRRRFAECFTEAVSHVPYYGRIFGQAGLDPAQIKDFSELKKLPLLTKSQLRQDPDDFINPTREIVYVSKTGGTTGAPLVTPFDREGLRWGFSMLYRFYRSAGAIVADRSLHLTGQQVVPHSERSVYWRRCYADNSLFLSIHHLRPENMPKYFQAVKDFKPVWVEGYTSFIHELAQWINDHGHAGEVRLAAALPSSETLTATMREDTEKAFATRVFNHYGATEGIPLITECPAGNLHIVPESGVIEFLRPDGSDAEPGEPAEMVVTSFRVPSRPILRYRIGDTGSYSDAPCSCGRTWRRVEELHGRMAEWVVTREGKRISQFSHQIFKVSHHVKESQIVQEAPDRFHFKLVRYPEYGDEDEQFIRDRVAEIMGHACEIRFEYLEQIPRTAGGKRPTIICNVAKPT